MSLSALRLDLALPTDQLRITPLHDPVVDLLGHDLRSAYVERFWLPILGPTTTLLLRRLAVSFDDHPDGFDLPLLDTAAALGLGHKGGRNSPFLRALARATTFKIAEPSGHATLAVRRRVAPLTRTQVERLPTPLNDEHARWTAAVDRRPDADQQRRRSRRLALSLAELGEPDEAIERQLHHWKVHPALAHDALRWARARQHGTPTPTTPSAPPPPPGPGASDPRAGGARRSNLFAPTDRAPEPTAEPDASPRPSAGDAA